MVQEVTTVQGEKVNICVPLGKEKVIFAKIGEGLLISIPNYPLSKSIQIWESKDDVYSPQAIIEFSQGVKKWKITTFNPTQIEIS